MSSLDEKLTFKVNVMEEVYNLIDEYNRSRNITIIQRIVSATNGDDPTSRAISHAIGGSIHDLIIALIDYHEAEDDESIRIVLSDYYNWFNDLKHTDFCDMYERVMCQIIKVIGKSGKSGSQKEQELEKYLLEVKSALAGRPNAYTYDDMVDFCEHVEWAIRQINITNPRCWEPIISEMRSFRSPE